MTDTTKQYEVLRTLNLIEAKTKSAPLTHGGKQVVYGTLEVFCYLVFLMVFICSFLFPSAAKLEIHPEHIQMKLGITVEQLDLALMIIRITLLFLSLFPLGMGLLIRSSRRKSRKLYEVNKLVMGVIGEVVR